MAKKIESIKHNKDTRAHIPSKEEAGYEEANPKVQQGKKTLELPKNPVVHRGQDPELFWLGKYGNDDREDLLRVDIRSLYRHEHISPEVLIQNLYKVARGEWRVNSKTGKREFLTTNHSPLPEQLNLFNNINELFGNSLDIDEIEKVSEYYHHQDGWTNRLIQGDSLLVMASLLEREGMAGQVQTIYFDPPYGIKYGGNWQIKLNNRDVKDGSDEALTGEPEQIKAFRDTWELGIHSYLSYLRDRLLIAKELLTESGSCFVQISDENVHLVRSVMDEVFGSENFVSMISFKTKKMALGQSFLGSVNDYIIWFAKKIDLIKYRQLFINRDIYLDNSQYNFIELSDGSYRRMTKEEKEDFSLLPKGAKIFRTLDLHSSGRTESCVFDFELNGQKCSPARGRSWKTNKNGIQTLIKKNRLLKVANNPEYKLFYDDYPVQSLMNIWDDTQGASGKLYVVQTTEKAIQRCILMTSDPGDLVLDPTCGSGTTAFVAEQWGRRWITIDTSRIAMNIAKTRLMTSAFPYYYLYSDVEVEKIEKDGKIKKTIKEKPEQEKTGDIRQGFVYEEVPHITLKSLANDEPPETETLYDKPYEDKTKLRVCGPFTVETLQSYEPLSPDALLQESDSDEQTDFAQVVKSHLESAGIKNGRKDEQVVFSRVELLSHSYLHAEGFYNSGERLVASDEKKLTPHPSSLTTSPSSLTPHPSSLTPHHTGERKAYIHIGPKFGTVSKNAVNEAVKECRLRGDAQWLIILGFSFESDIEGSTQTMSMGKFEVTKARIHDDLLQEGLKKKPGKSAASFVTIGEPDIEVVNDEWLVNSKGEIICNYGIFKKLSGLDSLAKVNGLSEADLRAYSLFSQRRDVWLNLSDAKGSSFNFSEYSRRASEKFDWRVSSVLGNSERFFIGARDFDYFISELGLSEFGRIRSLIESYCRDKQNAQWLTQIPEVTQLTTHHYSLITIKGLDIYDPIKDEVKARNVSDIAYWMVDDDYDGSNFIVKQVFFCGGDKDEFDKWKKGLESLAKDSTKKKVEKTLKIEIDDEAFDRLYGHISHPIEVKKKGQKIAVRVISQFGEETTKVLTV